MVRTPEVFHPANQQEKIKFKIINVKKVVRQNYWYASAGFSVAFGSAKSRGSASGIVLFVLQVQGEGEGEGQFQGACPPGNF